MDSEVADHHENGVHEHFSLGSSADLTESNHSGSINSSDPSPPDSFNGHLHHHLPSTDPLTSNHSDLSAELKSSKADNQVLVEEITYLRDAHAAMEHTQELLQGELLGNSGKIEALNADVALLEVEKKKQEDLAACTAQELHALHAENMDLQAENGNTISQIKSIDVMLAEIKEKSSLLAKDVGEKQAAMAAAQTRVNMICFEIEKLQLEREEYSKEVSSLEASNDTIDREISQLREEEKALSNEVDHFVAAKALAEQNVSNMHAHIAALKAQFSTNTESDEQMQIKLFEAKDRLRHLEEEDKAMALREREMETRIVDLESKLRTLKADFDNMERAEEQESEAGPRSLEVMHMKAAASERELHVLKAASDAKQQHVQELQSRVSNMREGKEALARTNEELQEELPTTQEKAEAEESIQLRKDIKRLESTLNEAEERARLSESKEVELRCKLQELIILTKRKPRLAGLATSLIISGGTVAALGLLVYVLRFKSKSK